MNKLIIVADSVADELLADVKSIKKLSFKDKVKVGRELVSTIKAIREEKDENQKVPDLALLISDLENNEIKRVTRKRAVEQVEVDIE